MIPRVIGEELRETFWIYAEGINREDIFYHGTVPLLNGKPLGARLHFYLQNRKHEFFLESPESFLLDDADSPIMDRQKWMIFSERRAEEIHDKRIKQEPCKDLLKLILTLINFPDSKICKHHVALDILSLMGEKYGYDLDEDLIKAIIDANDDLAITMLNQVIQEETC